MRPVAIFRFSPGDEPGRFAHWLDAHARPWRLVSLHDGEPVPEDARAFAGIGMMGGPMSVNDMLPWIGPMERLIREAVDARVPVIGHCLGGQLLAKSLGATVGRARTTEIGWIDVDVVDSPAAREWFGGRGRFTMFEWHYEAFTLPPGAVRVLTNAFNENQAYVVAVNRCGSDPEHSYAGGTAVYGPHGETLAAAGSEPATVRAHLSPAAVADWRARFPALRDRRRVPPALAVARS